jgi:catechol 2,3-dioxygenase-like lactoylglutathione lyase family enzyme
VVQPIEILAFSHIGFIVDNVDGFRATWGPILGLDEWLVREVGQAPGRVQLHGFRTGEPVTSRVAFAKFRGTAIELIEPLQGASGAREWLAANGEGMQHIGVWVRDLPTALARLDGQIEITYSPAALHPALAGRPVAATVGPESSPESAPIRPPFWAYVEPIASSSRWSLELLDAKFADDYRAYYRDGPFYPGELPGSFSL